MKTIIKLQSHEAITNTKVDCKVYNLKWLIYNTFSRRNAASIEY